MAFTLGLVSQGAAQAQAQNDFRSGFPSQYTETPMGVNLQSGRFHYWLFSFAMGPFATERGFGKSGFPFIASLYWHTVQTATGAGQPVVTINIGSPAFSMGSPIPLVQSNYTAIYNSWLRGADTTRLDFYSSTGAYYIWWNTASVGYRLSRSAGQYVLTDQSGSLWTFQDAGGSYPNPDARLSNVTYADGSRIDLTFDSAGRIQFMQSNRGYAVRYEYLSGSAQTKVCGFNLAFTHATATTSCSSSSYVVTLNNTIQADGTVQPISVVDLTGQTSTISYTGYAGNFPQCMTLPNSSVCDFTNSYGPQGSEPPQLTKRDQVRVQVDANGNTYEYGYDNPASFNGDDPPQYPGGPAVLSYAWMNAPGYSVQGNYENGLLRQISAPGGGPVDYEYDGVNPRKATWVGGRNIVITRDYVGNALQLVENPSGGSLAAITRTQTFPTNNLYGNPSVCQAASDRLCDKPIAQVDGRSNQTDYTYDPAHGGALTATMPAGANGVRPQIRYEYSQRYAWVKNSGGTFSQASAPIWVKTRERSCRTTAASGQSCAGGASDETITDYDYGPDSGPNNLLLRGVVMTAGGVTLRTCYNYDGNGRKISETTPNASLTSCP